ncbi:MAG: hypothetical protein MHM6MM_002283 [Cercozoa sp. M6MM]
MPLSPELSFKKPNEAVPLHQVPVGAPVVPLERVNVEVRIERVDCVRTSVAGLHTAAEASEQETL